MYLFFFREEVILGKDIRNKIYKNKTKENCTDFIPTMPLKFFSTETYLKE